MKIDKYSAILGNTVGYHDMDILTNHRPLASLPFGGKYRLIDFPLSNLANAGIRSVFGIFHLHSTTQQPITVVYKKLAKDSISDVNAVLEIDETDKVVGHQLFAEADQELYNMSTDIFVVDTPFLIEKLEEEAAKEEPRKLRYVLRDLAVAENAFAYEYTGYLSNIHSVKSYYDANLDMLDSQKFYNLFAPNHKVYTKVKNEEPTYYAENSLVKRSQFASGSIVRGHVENSVISRNTEIEEGATVLNSIIFPRVHIHNTRKLLGL